MSAIDFDIFRENLRTLRKTTDKTSKELSEDLGMRQMKRVSDIEEGRGRPTLEEINATCTYFEVSIDDMIRRKAVHKIVFIDI